MALRIFEPAESPFEIIYADITHRCNMACKNCFVPNRTIPDMDIGRYRDVVGALPRSTEIRLIGGEPTLSPNLIDYISINREFGHTSVLVTNGLLLSDFDFAKKLKDAELKYVYISASGLDDDSIYLVTDRMECARQKMQAVAHCETMGFEIGLGCLLLSGVNTHIVSRLVHFAANLKVRTRVNFRNVGLLGRHTQDTSHYLKMDDMIRLIADQLGIAPKKITRFRKSDHQVLFPYTTGDGRKIRIKITDWQPEGETIPDPGSTVRGRITQDYRLAPFFEHVKANEFGY